MSSCNQSVAKAPVKCRKSQSRCNLSEPSFFQTHFFTIWDWYLLIDTLFSKSWMETVVFCEYFQNLNENSRIPENWLIKMYSFPPIDCYATSLEAWQSLFVGTRSFQIDAIGPIVIAQEMTSDAFTMKSEHGFQSCSGLSMGKCEVAYLLGRTRDKVKDTVNTKCLLFLKNHYVLRKTRPSVLWK